MGEEQGAAAVAPKEIDRLGLRAWLVTALSGVVLLIGQWIPLPGVDAQVIAAAQQGQGDVLGLFALAAPLASIFSLGVGGLLLVRGAVALLGAFVPGESRLPWSVVGFAVYMLLTALSGFGVALGLESMNGASPFGDVVYEPGWGFRTFALLSFCTAGAVLWALATWITRRGVGHGPLVLFGFHSLLLHVEGAVREGIAWGEGWGEPAMALAEVGMALPATVALLLLWMRPPPRWPVTLRGDLSFLSPVDVVIAPYAAASLVVMPFQLGAAYVVAMSTMASQVTICSAPLFATATAVGLSIWWWRREPSPSRRLGPLLFGLCVLPMSLVLVLGGFAFAGGLTRMIEPGPFEGDAAYRITLESDVGDGARDAPILRDRFEALGVTVEVNEAGPGRIELWIDGVRDGREVAEAVVPQRALAFHLVAEDQEAIRPRSDEVPPPGVRVGSDYGFGAVWMAEEPEALAPVLERVVRVPGRVALIECRTSDDDAPRGSWEEPPRECLVRLLEDPPMITGADVVDASVAMNDYDQRPVVMLEFGEEGTRRFAEGTGAAVRRQLAIVLDDRVLSTPVIQEAITGGKAQITLGAFNDYETLMGEAQSLAIALRMGALQSPWRIAEVEPLP